MRALVTDFWLKLAVESWLGIEAVLARSLEACVHVLAPGGDIDLVVLGDLDLGGDAVLASQFVERTAELPMLLCGGWSSYQGLVFEQAAFLQRLGLQLGSGAHQQHIHHLALAPESVFEVPVHRLPLIAGRHDLRPAPGALVVLQDLVGKRPMGIWNPAGPRSLCLTFPLSPGGAQKAWFHRYYPAFLRECVELLAARPVPGGEGPLVSLIRGTYEGGLARQTISRVADGLAGLTEHESVQVAAVMAIEHRYFDLGANLERRAAEIAADEHERKFRLARAAQVDGDAHFLAGDYRRAALAFDRASLQWIARHSHHHHNHERDVGFCSSWHGWALLCHAFAGMDRGHPWREWWPKLAEASRALGEAGESGHGHGMSRSASLLPKGVGAVFALRNGGALTAPLRWPVPLVTWRLKRAVRDQGPSTVGQVRAVTRWAQASLAPKGSELELLRTFELLDHELGRGEIDRRTWLVLTTLSSMMLRLSILQESPISGEPVFLSYSRDDSEVVSACCDALADCGVPVHLDQRSVGLGLPIRSAIEVLVDRSPNFVLFVSQASVADAGGWIRAEMERAVGSGRKLHFLTVLLEDVRLPGFLGSRLALDASAMSPGEIARRLGEHFGGERGWASRQRSSDQAPGGGGIAERQLEHP